MTGMPSPVGAPDAPLVLVVDDEPELRDEIAETLNDCGVPALAASGAGEAVDLLLAHRSILVVLTDLRMPEHDGFELVEHLKLFCVGPHAVETVLLTGHGGPAEALRAEQSWLAGFLRKPPRLGEMRAVLEQAAEMARTRRRAAMEAPARAPGGPA